MISCEKCGAPIEPDHINTGRFTACAGCGAQARVQVFTAAVKDPGSGRQQEAVILPDDAGCFYHPAKKAVVPCSACGRFLCALCDVDFDGEHICFSCLENGQGKTVSRQLDTHRFLPDGLAIRLSIIPPLSMVFSFFSCITAPVSIYLALRYWSSASSITPRRTKLRFSMALLFSLAQVAGWAGIIFMVVNSSS